MEGGLNQVFIEVGGQRVVAYFLQLSFIEDVWPWERGREVKNSIKLATTIKNDSQLSVQKTRNLLHNPRNLFIKPDISLDP